MDAKRVVSVGEYRCGASEPLMLIAGPCVLESVDQAMRIAEVLAVLNQRSDLQVVIR